MNLIRYNTAISFLDENMDMLLKNEAQNNLILGNALRGKVIGSDDYYMVPVKRKILLYCRL